eukprot:gb/GEZJ01003522.1/.p1 GENE.gb/GEZJ01003522.1/~~gb/GEZJ01003522.1/.p1  ORF type:complete len:354 (-),score=32.73 gb/GEZJ01003522.1/:1281-2342(-)
MLAQSHGMTHFVTENAHCKEELAFKKTVREVPLPQVPEDANIIRRHVFYKIKKCDDSSMVLKARIAPHSNDDKHKHALKTDYATRLPVGIRILFSISTIHHWVLAKIDFKSAFLQPGDATRDVYMIPARECATRHRFYWLLLTAAYGHSNASAKWQQLSDNLLHSIGFKQLVWVPQLFYRNIDGKLTCVAINIVDDVLFSAPRSDIEDVIRQIQRNCQLGTIVFGPGTFQFCGLTVTQDEDFSVKVHGDDKLIRPEALPIDRNRRRQFREPLNALELASFRSFNSSIGWLGIAASPFCATASSLLQQKGPHVKVSDIVTQFNVLRNLKKRGTCSRYPCPPKGSYDMSVLVFCR